MIAGTDMKTKRELSRKQQKVISYASVGLFLLMLVLICAVIGRPMVRVASDPDKFRDWVDGHGVWGMLAYMGMVALQVLAALIPGEPLEIAGGYAFGAVKGTLLCLLAASLGSAAVICLVRRYGMRLVEVFFPREKIQSLRFLRSSPRRTLLFLLIFMLPGTPKDLLCYYAGLTDIKLPMLLIICSLGRIPSIVTSTAGGDALGTESYLFALIIFAATFMLSALGLFLYNMLCKRHENKRASAGKRKASPNRGGGICEANDGGV